jgi:hypothetical protein
MEADAPGVVTVTVLGGGYRALVESLTVITRRANSAKELRSRTPAKLYSCKTILERLPQDLQDMAAELRQLIQEEHPVVGQGDVAGRGDVSAADQPHVRDGVMRGAQHGRVVTKAVRSPVRPATRGRHVVSMASAKVMAGRMVMTRRASIDIPAPEAQ